MIQGSEEWKKARLGKVTASRVADIMAKTKSGAEAASRKNYMMELLCERLTGNYEEGFVSSAMQRGTDMEPIARSIYEMGQDVIVEEVGVIDHADIKGFAASPDGLVRDDGLIEIKCPNTAQHVKFLRTGNIDKKYMWQMRAQMSCANRDWCDFISFDDRLPESLQYKSFTVERCEKTEKEMIEEIEIFLDELESLIREIT